MERHFVSAFTQNIFIDALTHQSKINRKEVNKILAVNKLIGGIKNETFS